MLANAKASEAQQLLLDSVITAIHSATTGSVTVWELSSSGVIQPQTAAAEGGRDRGTCRRFHASTAARSTDISASAAGTVKLQTRVRVDEASAGGVADGECLAPARRNATLAGEQSERTAASNTVRTRGCAPRLLPCEADSGIAGISSAAVDNTAGDRVQ